MFLKLKEEKRKLILNFFKKIIIIETYFPPQIFLVDVGLALAHSYLEEGMTDQKPQNVCHFVTDQDSQSV